MIAILSPDISIPNTSESGVFGLSAMIKTLDITRLGTNKSVNFTSMFELSITVALMILRFCVLSSFCIDD